MIAFFQTIVAVYFLSTFASIHSPENPTDFLGTWKFNEYKSDPYTNMSKQVKINEKGDTLLIERLEKNDSSFSEPVLLDGRKFQCITTSGRKKVGEAKWLYNKTSFVEQAVLYNLQDTAKIDFLVTEQWNLSDDTKELTLITLVSFAGQMMKSKAVFDKQ
jgi:hypothetical protein